MAERECGNPKCNEPATRRCSACTDRRGWYCSERCQRKAWPLHIFDCNTTKPAKTAYHMAIASLLNIPPPHWQTKQDYGFSKLSPEDQMTLLDVCRMLLGPMGIVEPKTLDRWMTRNTLPQEIKAAFQACLQPVTRVPSCGFWRTSGF
ncbi:hypothetical protein FIBSPDRAFT_210407 [Athelia psychrophila]|uniref:MYND-type domain-containing protein n=1 Tax=Athelia psychrophila TaxID=1759441 RepID=A0A166WRG6_9AGAM|nr:hypothetical protein FIBSPDRAFT_210407 [Fibularhizoctonia sp. CBS 109695]